MIALIAIAVGCLVSGFLVAMAGQRQMGLALCALGACSAALGALVDVTT